MALMLSGIEDFGLWQEKNFSVSQCKEFFRRANARVAKGLKSVLKEFQNLQWSIMHEKRDVADLIPSWCYIITTKLHEKNISHQATLKTRNTSYKPKGMLELLSERDPADFNDRFNFNWQLPGITRW